MGRAYSTNWGKEDEKEKRNACRILVEKPEVKRPLEIPKSRWMIILKWILER
jgi:hypothetical protein